MAWYRAGTATFTNGSRNVTGAGTAWATNVRPGDEIIGPDNISREVETVTSDTALTMVETYAGSTAAGAAYKVKPIQGWNRDVAAQLAALINDYGSIEAALAVVAGKIGIGTLTPQHPLSVATSGDAIGLAVGEAGSTTGKIVEVGYFGATDCGRIQAVHQGTGFKSLALNPSGGNVGVGISTPQAGLHVNRASAATARVSASNVGLDIQSLDSSAHALIGTYTSHPLVLTTAGAERVRISSTGNVGVGISPSFKLDVGASGDANATVMRFQSGGFATTFSHDMVASIIANNSAIRGIALAPNGSTALLAMPGGNVGVGTDAPGARLHVNGTVRLDVAVTGTNSGAGGSQALPSNPAGYAIINIGGLDRKIPYYP